jgi:hypothetical protein
VTNADQSRRWRPDLSSAQASFDAWFVTGGRKAYQEARRAAAAEFHWLLDATDQLRGVTGDLLREAPRALGTLRMTAAPPMARDRLAALARVDRPVINALEQGRMPARISMSELDAQLGRICAVLEKAVDPDVFTWLGSTSPPTEAERSRSALVVADRRCDSVADQIVRQAIRDRQGDLLRHWLEERGYREAPDPGVDLNTMPPGSFRLGSVPVQEQGGRNGTRVDAVIRGAPGRQQRLLVLKAISAADLTTDRRGRLVHRAPLPVPAEDAELLLLLGPAVDLGYLQDRADEGVDWIWEHRIEDLALAGV